MIEKRDDLRYRQEKEWNHGTVYGGGEGERRTEGKGTSPASTFEGIGDLTDGNGDAVGILDGNTSLVSDALTAHSFKIHVRHAGLRLRHVRHFFRYIILRLIHQIHTYPDANYPTINRSAKNAQS